MKLRHLLALALAHSLVACVEPVRSGGDGGGTSSGGTSSGGTSSGGTSSGGTSSGGTSSGGTSSGGTSSGGTSSGGTSSGGTSSGGTPCPAAATGGTTVSIDAGGPAAGTFRADAFHAGGATFTTDASIDTSGIACDAPPAAVFQSERYGEFTYTIPNRTPGTTQTVTLYFQESFFAEAGQRTFDVAIDGKTVLAAFDILAAAGGARRGIARSFTTTAAADGRVVIDFVKTGPDNPKVCGITVAGEGGDPGSGAAACPATALRPGDTRRTITVDGVVRSYVLHVPQGYAGTEPVPLLLDFHGYGGDGAAQQAISGFNQQSDQHGFIAAFPDAIGGCWNPGVPGLSCGNDDLGFARALVRELSTLACVDAKRVYASGFSQGGGMVYWVACKAADLFAAGAPSAFDLGFDCAPSRPISILSFRGTADRYDGSGNALFGAPRTLETWKQLDGCTGATTDWMGCAVYASCREGTEAGLCSIQGGGHGPGSAETGWAFLSRHALP